MLRLTLGTRGIDGPVQAQLSAVRAGQPAEDPGKGGLARPVGADQGVDLAALETETEIGEHGYAIALGDIPGFQEERMGRLKSEIRTPNPGGRTWAFGLRIPLALGFCGFRLFSHFEFRTSFGFRISA